MQASISEFYSTGYTDFEFWFTFQVKRHLRLQQPQQLQPRSPEDSQTTALPGQSTTASKQHTTAHPILNPWVQHHKPPRYIPIKNLSSTWRALSVFAAATPFPTGLTGFQWAEQLQTQNIFFSLHRFKAESTVSAVNMQCMFYVFLCTGPVMWSGHKVNATLSKTKSYVKCLDADALMKILNFLGYKVFHIDGR